MSFVFFVFYGMVFEDTEGIKTMPQPATSKWYYRDDSSNSDKEYNINLVERDGGWMVECFYGRRGHCTSQTNKTRAPTTFEAAEKVYEKQCRERLAKGYQLVGGENAPPVAAPPRENTGLMPQLLDAWPEGQDVEPLLGDRAHVAQEKFDGERLIVKRDGAEFVFSNRRGVRLPEDPAVVGALMASPARDFVLDGEKMSDGRFIVFDCLSHNGTDLRDSAFIYRYNILKRMFPGEVGVSGLTVVRAPLATTAPEKRALYERVKNEGGEGVVFKGGGSRYRAGKNHLNQFKVKFWKDCSCIVTGINLQSSVSLAMLSPRGRVSVGNVTIPPNHPTPQIGSIVDVRYLYAYRGGSLYQPVYRGVRSDVDESDCLLHTLSFKNESPPDAPKVAAADPAVVKPEQQKNAENGRARARRQKELEAEDSAPILDF